MNLDYLPALEALLKLGTMQLSPGFITTQTSYINSIQQHDGGFSGRQGGSDLWYTEFALRSLALFTPPDNVLRKTADWLQQVQSPKNVVDCFSLLNAQRILALNNISLTLNPSDLYSILENQKLLTGGFSRSRQDQLSAYQTFIACLCLQLIGIPIDNNQATVNALLALQQSSGGFCEQSGDTQAQTSATAAALGALALCDALNEEISGQALQWLRTMQGVDGGFLAHAQAPFCDLLSTFTALTTFALSGDLNELDLKAVARFLRQAACPGGGFKACFIDDAPDTEYTYYGLGCLCLLRAAIAFSS